MNAISFKTIKFFIINHNLKTTKKLLFIPILININVNEAIIVKKRISSRINTVIRTFKIENLHVNYNCYNEPFTASSINQLKLPNAWLNLKDKHMTTGRINQVIPKKEKHKNFTN